MYSVAAIILAAGQSQRMGGANKLLLPVAGQPMIRHVVKCYRAAIDGPIIVVTGHDASNVEAALDHIDAHCTFNPDHKNGQQTAVALGLSHAPDANLLLIGLGDQPLLQSADIRDLIAAHQSADPLKISIPAMDHVRGNPIVVPHSLRAMLTADQERPGCMRFRRDNPARVQRHALPAAGFYTDIDTPNDYAALTSDKEFIT
ncbi:molybdenum cofactor cytidylyltransferase [Cognatiyoonia koreensis]|uniref:Molybdenum cofactor cytidylyltransferase n=1 Tax=Cognatiyoonia koreensis TaxID=364200 RepID=A0A1I0QYM2_9RHOB|nr:nucleotidyltransferase family protein [Cognatiyoonia koreensis]SEW32738.1 molybdenum cofactor cytidylyltransferase [Cognatiyoonia koreensis]